MRIGPYRLFFYSNQNGEPPHIHIQKERAIAKFWLGTVSLASSIRFTPKEIRDLQKIVLENKSKLLEPWNEYFKN